MMSCLFTRAIWKNARQILDGQSHGTKCVSYLSLSGPSLFLRDDWRATGYSEKAACRLLNHSAAKCCRTAWTWSLRPEAICPQSSLMKKTASYKTSTNTGEEESPHLDPSHCVTSTSFVMHLILRWDLSCWGFLCLLSHSFDTKKASADTEGVLIFTVIKMAFKAYGGGFYQNCGSD